MSNSTNVTGMIDMAGGHAEANMSWGTFVASLTVGAAVFAIEFVLWLYLRRLSPRVYTPKAWLVPTSQRTTPPANTLFDWFFSLFRIHDPEFIQKCGLDAYFFLRFLVMLIKIFSPLACSSLPVLIALNATAKHTGTNVGKVEGIDKLGWQNIQNTAYVHRYWAHLVAGVMTVIWACYCFQRELHCYIRIRHTHLTAPQHRLRASATTLLIGNIPPKLMSEEALNSMFDVFPGGVRNVWLNRNFDELDKKIKQRARIARLLENAEVYLILMAVANEKKLRRNADKALGIKRTRTEQRKLDAARNNEEAQLAEETTVTSGENLPPVVEATVPELGPPATPAPKRSKPKGFWTFMHPPTASLHSREASHETEPSCTDFAPRGSLEHEPSISEGSPDVSVQDSSSVHTEATAVDAAPAMSLDGARDPAVPEMKVRPEKLQYPPGFYDHVGDDYDTDAVWRKYVDPSDRETMRLPLLDHWSVRLPLLDYWRFPSLPFVGKKVDIIYHCRRELGRLNQEIRIDQMHPENYPLGNSAFIQFNSQIAAHLAAQATTYHGPMKLNPRTIEVSPDDVIWQNMSVTWWSSYARTPLSIFCAVAVILLWVVPVAFASWMKDIPTLVKFAPRLSFLLYLRPKAQSVFQGVAPPFFLAWLLSMLPSVFRFIATMSGAPTKTRREQIVQNYFFAFLFVQVFLIVSISTGITKALGYFINSPLSVPEVLADNLPTSSSFFFSFMILQALAISSGALVQVGRLINWYILARLDSTPREKFMRMVQVPSVNWGQQFPVYTNLAVIGLVYSVITPFILVCAIFTFGLFWVVYRYQSLYVNGITVDTGGVLFPRAIYQLFWGLYFMMLCFIGLCLTTVDDQNRVRTYPQACIMAIALILTGCFHYTTHYALQGLLLYIPISKEDEASARDDEFNRLLEKRQKVAQDKIDKQALKEKELVQAEMNSEEMAAEHAKELERTGTKGLPPGNYEPTWKAHQRLAPKTWARMELNAKAEREAIRAEEAEEHLSKETKRADAAEAEKQAIAAEKDAADVEIARAMDKIECYQRKLKRALGGTEFSDITLSSSEESSFPSRHTDEESNSALSALPRSAEPSSQSDGAYSPQAVAEALANLEGRSLRNSDVPSEPATASHVDERSHNSHRSAPSSTGAMVAAPRDPSPRGRALYKAPTFRMPGLPGPDPESLSQIHETIFGALYSGLEDLLPEHRESLVKKAFLHKALRERHPCVWICNDYLGVSADEQRQTKRATAFMWLSNKDSRINVEGETYFQGPPPDWKEEDLLNL